MPSLAVDMIESAATVQIGTCCPGIVLSAAWRRRGGRVLFDSGRQVAFAHLSRTKAESPR